MANSLNIDLTGKTVVVKNRDKHFVCEDGFGCQASTNGSKIFGHYKGEVNEKGEPYKEWISGYTVESVVEEDKK